MELLRCDVNPYTFLQVEYAGILGPESDLKLMFCSTTFLQGTLSLHSISTPVVVADVPVMFVKMISDTETADICSQV